MTDKQKVIHVKRFDGGRRTPAEYHREAVYGGKKCHTCTEPAAMKVHFLAQVDEFKRREPGLYELACLQFGGDPSFPTIHGPMLRIETVYACAGCRVSLKKYAARKPDWVMAEFDEQGLEESHKLVIAAR